jgi:arylformamidase
MAVIDLSLTIHPNWRWPVEITQPMDFDRGDPYRVTKLTAPMHAFTHIDSPLHMEAGRHSLDQADLNRLCGPAAILDLTPIQPDQEIGLGLIQERWSVVQPGDIVLLKTAWDTQRSIDSKEYWTEAPYVSPEAAAWLGEQDIKTVGFDFPQDWVIREIPARHPSAEEMPTHNLILRKGIYMIEYLCNLDSLKQSRVELYALPLKLQGSEGGCARVVAVV